jgi:hypothetical protein
MASTTIAATISTVFVLTSGPAVAVVVFDRCPDAA